MGKSSKPPLILDAEGDLWPPPHALAAFVDNYGGSPAATVNGALVEVGAYLPEHYLFETYVVNKQGPINAGEVLLCAPAELKPLNDYTTEYIASAVEARIPVYADEVYDLRDRLDEIGVAATAESINDWTAVQRANVEAYIRIACGGGPKPPKPPKPKELL